jgi:ATP adenylyltransferase
LLLEGTCESYGFCENSVKTKAFAGVVPNAKRKHLTLAFNHLNRFRIRKWFGIVLRTFALAGARNFPTLIGMDHLWAPWRLSYVASAKPPATGDPCFICQGLAKDRDRENLLVFRSQGSVVLLNRFPYNNGHLLIAPTAHLGHLSHLDAAQMQDTMATMQRMLGLLDELLHPDGYNIGLNQGAAAGAGLPGHLHWHVVPRWHGDTNFMPILGDVKVVSQSLEALYDLLIGRLI